MTERKTEFLRAGATAEQLVQIEQNVAEINTLKNTALIQSDTVINSATDSLIDLPTNAVYSVDSGITNFKDMGLPMSGAGTLLKYSPNTKSNTRAGFNVYVFTTWRYQYFAFAYDNYSPSDLTWRRLNYCEQINKGIENIGVSDLSIVFIGDSIVEGYGSSDYNGGASGTSGHLIQNNVKTWYRNTGSTCWANQMINYLTNTYNKVTACNNAIGGFTPQQIYENIDTLTLDDSGNRANVAILSIGTNSRDASDKEASIVEPIRKTISWLRKRSIQPIVLTNTPLMDAAKGNNAETIQSCIIRACNIEQIHCYDLLSRMKRYMWENNIPLEASTDQTKIMHDSLHPSDIGYEIMFNLIKEIMIV